MAEIISRARRCACVFNSAGCLRNRALVSIGFGKSQASTCIHMETASMHIDTEEVIIHIDTEAASIHIDTEAAIIHIDTEAAIIHIDMKSTINHSGTKDVKSYSWILDIACCWRNRGLVSTGFGKRRSRARASVKAANLDWTRKASRNRPKL